LPCRLPLSLMGTPPQGPPMRRSRAVTKSQTREAAVAPMTVSPGKLVEGYVVGVLFRKPELLYRLDRSLRVDEIFRFLQPDGRAERAPEFLLERGAGDELAVARVVELVAR